MKLKATVVCPGKVLAPCHVVTSIPAFDLETKVKGTQSEAGKAVVNEAVETVLSRMQENSGRHAANADLAGMVEVQRSMLTDSYFLQEVYDNIAAQYPPHIAVLRAAQTQVEMLRSLQDETMAARAEDMRDASTRLAVEIAGLEYPDLSSLQGPVILVGEDLLPSMLLNADFENIMGIVMEGGTRTSHVSILAAGLDIPMVVGCAGASKIQREEPVYLDAESGTVEYGFGEEKKSALLVEVEAYAAVRSDLLAYAERPAVSAAGEALTLFANIIDPLTLDKVLEYGMDGVGLFRTEFMYMNRSTLPSEEEQFTVYKMVAEKLAGKPVIIRTMDIGGDKEVEALGLVHEDNPFMGFRAIRICLARPELFAVQLRAILRSSAFGNIRVMFPMISTRNELEQALAALRAEQEKLRAEGIPFDEGLKAGIMVEVPSAVVLMDQLAPMVDFVSIGSNDLVQYTYAADRLNHQVEYLYNPMDPAVLRLMRHVIKTADAAGAECSLCGEMGGDALGLPALAALGLKKFSVSTAWALASKKRMSLLDTGKLASVGEAMLQAKDADEATAILKAALPPNYS